MAAPVDLSNPVMTCVFISLMFLPRSWNTLSAPPRFCSSSPKELMTSFPSLIAAAPAAIHTAPTAVPTFFSTSPKPENLFFASSAASPASSTLSSSSPALSAAESISFAIPDAASPESSNPEAASSRAALLLSSSRSISLRAASALFNCICQL